MTGVRVLAAIPFVITGKALTDLGYLIAGGTAPHRRR